VQATNAFLERRSWMPVEVAAAVVVVVVAMGERRGEQQQTLGNGDVVLLSSLMLMCTSHHGYHGSALLLYLLCSIFIITYRNCIHILSLRLLFYGTIKVFILLLELGC